MELIKQTALSFNLLYSSQCNGNVLMSPIFVHIQQMKYMYEILLSRVIYMLIAIFTLFHDSCFLNQPTISLKKKIARTD